MGRGNLRDINAHFGPQNTMKRLGAIMSAASAEPSPKRRRENSDSSGITSPFFSKPIHVPDSVDSHKNGLVEIKSAKSTTSTEDQVSKLARVEEYRSTQRRNIGYKKPRKRYHKGNKPPGKAHISLSPSPSPGLESVMHLEHSGSQSVGSPDCLELDPPPAKVVSDIRPRVGRPKRSLATGSTDMPPRKCRRLQVEEIESSEDELQGDAPSRMARPIGDIKPTIFKSPTSSMTGARKIGDAIYVRRALAGRFILESQVGCYIQLEPASDGTSFAGIIPKPDGKREEYDWLRIVKKSLERIEHAETGSCFVGIRRSATESQPAKLYLEFVSTHESGRFLSYFTEKLVYAEPQYLEKTFTSVLRKTEEYIAQNPVASEKPSSQCASPTPRIVSPRVTDQPRHRAASFGTSCEEVIDNSSRTAAVNEKRPDSTHQKESAINLIPFTPSRRSARFSNAVLALGLDYPHKKWSRSNPGWRERWHTNLMYPLTGRALATVVEDDIPKLDDDEFLNDNLIQFYLSYLQLETESKNDSKKVYIFSTFFFDKLSYKSGKIDYDGVKRWTNKVDLFSYDYIVVPVNENLHWYLAIICNPSRALPETPTGEPEESTSTVNGQLTLASNTTPSSPGQSSLSPVGDRKIDPNEPRIMTLDSLGAAHSLTCKALKLYLAEEAKDKKGVELVKLPAGMTAKGLPEQQNFCDCGIFVLAYMEEFLRNPDEIAGKLLRREAVGWDIRPSGLRAKIRDLIFKLQNDQYVEHIREKRLKREAKKNKAVTTVSSGEAPLPQISPSKQVQAADASPLRDSASIMIYDSASKPPISMLEQASFTPKLETPVTPAACKETSPKLPSLLNSSSDDQPHEEAFYSAQSSPAERTAPKPKQTRPVSFRRGLMSGSEPDYVKKLSSSESDDGPSNTAPTGMQRRGRGFKSPEWPHDPFQPTIVEQIDADDVIPSVEADEPVQSKTGATYDGID